MNEIRCAVCNASNPAGSVYCGSCGTQIGFETGADGENRRYGAQIAQLRREIERLTGRLDRLQAEVTGREEQAPTAAEPEEPVATTPERAIEQEAAIPDQQAEPAAPSEPEEAAQPQEPVSEPEPVMAASGTDEPAARTVYIQGRPFEVPARQQPVGDSGELRLPLPSMPAVDWERVLGRNWLAIIGAVTLALGIGFFLKLSFDNNWIGDTGRILLGLGVGATLLGLGEYTKRRAPIWSQAVTAGGAATIYMSIYASYVLYELIRPDAAFYALGGVVWLAGILAVRYDSRVIGFLGIIGAFIAPLLLGPELPDVRLVLPYIAVVDLGILGVASVRNWRWFTISGWIGSYGLFAAGYAQYPETDPLLFQAGLDGHLPDLRWGDNAVPYQVEAHPGLAGYGVSGRERDCVLCADDHRVDGCLFRLAVGYRSRDGGDVWADCSHRLYAAGRAATGGDDHAAHRAHFPHPCGSARADGCLADDGVGGAGRDSHLERLRVGARADARIRAGSPGAVRRASAELSAGG